MANNPAPSKLNQQTIFQRAFDETEDRLRTDATFNGSFSGELNVEVSAADGDSVLISDGTNDVSVSNIGGKNGLDVNVLNDIGITASGLKTGLKTTIQTITDVPAQVPLVPLTDRNTVSIRLMGTSTVYFGEETVIWQEGYPKFQYEEMVADITDNPSVAIWAVCAPGQTCEIRVLEIA